MNYLTHSGTITATRNAPVLWEVMQELNIGLKIVGVMDYTVKESLKNINIIDYGYLSHKESIQLIREAEVLLLLINNVPNNKGILTGRLYEYLAARRPIIGIGPVDGEATDTLRETGHGIMIDYDDRDGMIKYLLSLKNWTE